MKKRLYFLTPILIIMPLTVSANMVWPSLYISKGLRSSWQVILGGLIIEFIFIKLFTKNGYTKSALMALLMNIVSTLVGIIAVPITGFLGEFVLYILFSSEGTFSTSHWYFAYITAILCNVLFEGLTLKLIFKEKFRKIFWWLFVANAISIIICIFVFGIYMDGIDIN